MSRRIIRTAIGLAAAALAVTAGNGAAFAHDAPLGDGGPFEVRITDSTMPESIEVRVGHGEMELHVPAGVEVVAIGVEGEPFAKVDAQGNMFGNLNSNTWIAAQDPDGGHGHGDRVDHDAGPEWEWVQGGGSLQYHEHRIHYMVETVDPDLAGGGIVGEWELEFTVDGAPAALEGVIEFDPELDPEAADRYLGRDGSSSARATIIVVVGVVGVLGVAAGAFAASRSRR